MVDSSHEDPPARGGRCVIVGRPNVGKSTLLNALLGQKLAIATSKPQTTRHRLLGVYYQAEPPTQIALVDTPGLHRPQSALGRALVEEAQAALSDADGVLWVVEAPTDARATPVLSAPDREVRSALSGVTTPIVLAINKIDRLKDKSVLLGWLTFYQETLDPAAIVPISALREKGLAPLVGALREHLGEGLLYEPDFLTDRPERFFAAEMVREAVIRATREEVPHAVAVVVESFEDTERLTRIEATLVVEKPNQKKILIGAGGSMLKEIGSAARKDLEEFLQRKVYLGLFVKVVPGWTSDPRSVRELAMGDGT